MADKIPRPGRLLAQINSPADLRRLKTGQMEQLCAELRTFIIDTVAAYGGHLGASLGVVELTVALHYVYNTPHDLLVWDVGHQAYGHKILTGRRDVFHTNRRLDGISGFTSRAESEYDPFGAGHSSTSVSAALGMAEAVLLSKSDKKAIAVIGDGAMTAGMAYEALNNAGASKADLLVILNDNNISIDANVGALKNHLAQLVSGRKQQDVLPQIEAVIKAQETPVTHNSAEKAAEKTKEHENPECLFTNLGFRYFGPLNGHNLPGLITALKQLRRVKGPKLLHVLTVKGKGFAPAEKEQTKWHASGGFFDKVTGHAQAAQKKQQALTYQQVFGETLVQLAGKNHNLVAVTPAMASGSNLLPMAQKYPDRVFDTGIAEQHAVTFSAGLAVQGKKVFCAIYSTFLQRAYDQLIHDVAIQNLPVIFCVDRAGFVGNDGPTHHGLYDISYMRAIPNMVISSPMNEQELQNMLYTASKYNESPWAIRYPRGEATGMQLTSDFNSIDIGTGRCLAEGEEIAVLSFGPAGNMAAEAVQLLKQEGISAGHYDIRFVKPLDAAMLREIGTKYRRLITVEDGTIKGGFGSAVAEFFAGREQAPSITMLGAPDQVTGLGTQQEQYRRAGMDAESIARNVRTLLNN